MDEITVKDVVPESNGLEGTRIYVLFSGGMDSFVALQWALQISEGKTPLTAITIDYGQPRGELKAAEELCSLYDVEQVEIGADFHFDEEAFKKDPYVPLRNLKLVTEAVSYIKDDIKDNHLDAKGVMLVAGLWNDGRFPDSTEDWMAIIQALLFLESPKLMFDFVNPLVDAKVKYKEDVYNLASAFGVPKEDSAATVSCWYPIQQKENVDAGNGKGYINETWAQCGACSKCKERQEVLKKLEEKESTRIGLSRELTKYRS